MLEYLIIAVLTCYAIAMRVWNKVMRRRLEHEVSWHARTMAKLAECEASKEDILQQVADQIWPKATIEVNGKLIIPRTKQDEWPEEIN